MDLTAFAEAVGPAGPVTVGGLGTRGGPVTGVRAVAAPAGIDWIQPEEMTVCCGAGTPVDDLDAALAEVGQRVALPPGGTVGGALAVGRSGLERLGRGPVRDAVLQVRYVSAAGVVVKAGGPTVKNVSGFDVCRLLVGSRGTLGFLGEVILRTWPRPRHAQWFVTDRDPGEVLGALYRPTSVLWDGASTWVRLEGHPADVTSEAAAAGLAPVGSPPPRPDGGRWSLPPSRLGELRGTGRFVAEVGVGVVHHELPPPPVDISAPIRELNRRIKHNFDPDGRLNPGVDVLDLRAERTFVDRPVGDEAAARRLAAELAAGLGRPEPRLLRAAMNATYAAGDVVIRVGRPTVAAAHAYGLADALIAAGVRVPAPAPGRPVLANAAGLTATAWERVVAAGPVDWPAVGAMVARLHDLDPGGLAPGYPVPLATALAWWRFDALLDEIGLLIDPGARAGLAAAVARHAGWVAATGGPERWVLCHGDVHPHNVVAGPRGPVILDWDLLCVGPPAWDHAPLLAMVARWGVGPECYDGFARGYGADLSTDPVAATLTELRLVAATLLRVRAEGTPREPGSEAERRLRFWRGDPGAPSWRFV